MTTPNKGFPELVANQSQPHVPINETFRALDVLVQMIAVSFLSTPPLSPADGDTYIVDASATGAWAGHEEEIVYQVGGGWSFIVPRIGWKCYVVGSAGEFQFAEGSPNGWAPVAAGGGGGSATLAGLTDVDLTNRADGFAIVWDSGTAKFVFVSIAAGGSISVTDLADVVAGSPGFQDGDTLVFDAASGNFIPGSGGGGGGGGSAGAAIVIGTDQLAASGSTGWTDYTFGCCLRAANILNFATTWKAGFNVLSGNITAGSIVVRRTLRGSAAFLDSAAVRFGGSLTPTIAAGYHLSDSIALQLDSDHDYYLLFHVSAADPGTASISRTTAPTLAGIIGGYVAGDHTADSTNASIAYSATIPAWFGAFLES